jgi:hypothetical protein
VKAGEYGRKDVSRRSLFEASLLNLFEISLATCFIGEIERTPVWAYARILCISWL